MSGRPAEYGPWARAFWATLAEGGVWGVPRCGLVFRKQAGQLILFDRMPWQEGMPLSAEDLRDFQDTDFAGVREMFAVIGVEVIDQTEGAA